jgi:hypothetical protein
MRETSRHAIHTSEILAATIETMTELQRYQIYIHESLSDGLEKHYKEQAKAYTDFQIQFMKSLKLRSESNQKRLENEINLVLNHPLQFRMSDVPISMEAYQCRPLTTSLTRTIRSSNPSHS